MRWILVEAAPRVLPEIDETLADYAVRELRGRGMDIRLETTLASVDADGVELSTGERHRRPHGRLDRRRRRPTRACAAMNVELDERGRVPVDDHLAVAGLDGVYAAGDCAAVPNPDGGLCPPTAQHAIRQARVAARNMASNLGVGSPETFDYHSRGAFVNLGQYKAVASMPGGVDPLRVSRPGGPPGPTT